MAIEPVTKVSGVLLGLVQFSVSEVLTHYSERGVRVHAFLRCEIEPEGACPRRAESAMDCEGEDRRGARPRRPLSANCDNRSVFGVASLTNVRRSHQFEVLGPRSRMPDKEAFQDFVPVAMDCDSPPLQWPQPHIVLVGLEVPASQRLDCLVERQANRAHIESAANQLRVGGKMTGV